MVNAHWRALLIVGSLLPVTVFADETASGENDQAADDFMLSVEALLAEPDYAFRSPLYPALEANDFSATWSRPINDFEFADGGTLGRVGKLRNLSLLTLAETKQTRLFLGVNEKGWVGLHFRAVSRESSERYLELVRMPYLEQVDAQQQTDH